MFLIDVLIEHADFLVLSAAAVSAACALFWRLL